jgi:predicted HicB family RNase H-like nuclease
MPRKPGYRRKRPHAGPVVPLPIRLPHKLKASLDQEAARREISLSAYIHAVLADHVRRLKENRQGQGGE